MKPVGAGFSEGAKLSLQLPIKVNEETKDAFKQKPYLNLAQVHNFAAKCYHTAQQVQHLDAFLM
jgi:hypothetical protein